MLEFVDFDLEESSNCTSDYVEVITGATKGKDCFLACAVGGGGDWMHAVVNSWSSDVTYFKGNGLWDVQERLFFLTWFEKEKVSVRYEGAKEAII